MNLPTVFKQGLEGYNRGLTTGLPKLDVTINGIQRGQSIGVAASPKVGKTTLSDFCFVLSPYLDMQSKGTLDNVDWIYWSYEISRIQKEFKFVSFFMAHDFHQYTFIYKDKLYGMNKEYLMSKQVHTNPNGITEFIKVSDEHSEMVREIYNTRIIPLFGGYDASGNKVPGLEGKIDFIEELDNPTGMYKYLKAYAKKNGQMLETIYQTMGDKGKMESRTRVTGYRPTNPNKYTIIITDHIRKLRRERGFTMKDNIDKWLEYTTELRNQCGFTFINIAHMNRAISNIDRLKMMGEYIFPTGDDVKDEHKKFIFPTWENIRIFSNFVKNTLWLKN